MLPLPRFEYLAPKTLEAGGTDIVPNLKHRLLEPRVLIGLSAIEDLAYIQADDDGGLRIGAMTRLADVRDHPEVRERAQVLAEAAGQIAGPQIQNMGTIGGNLCLDTRCVYYNQTHFWRASLGYCLKKDGTVCHVVEGGRNCVAASSADTAPALMCLDATVRIVGGDGEREIPVASLFKHPGDDYLTLGDDEIVAEVHVPPQPSGLKSGYAKLRIRKAIDFPIFSVGAAYALTDGRVSHIRMAATAMGSTPRKLHRQAKKVALDQPLDDARIDTLGAMARKKCVPLENINVDTAWRRAMVPVIVKRLLKRLKGSDSPPIQLGLRPI